jgi:two-component system sensor histidine kinase FlrB
VSAPLAASEADLREGFRAFVEASRSLESSYAALKQRAAAIDLELTSTNRALERALREKETILRALPVGVLAVQTDGAVIWSNPEGDRLRVALAALGCELTALPEGECERGGLCLAVRRAALPDGGTLLVVEDRSPLSRLAREVDRLDRIAGLSELALGIAHEIKNPLNGVMGFAALMKSCRSDEDLRRYASRVREGLHQVDDIVREMLAFARTPARAAAPEPCRAVIDRAASAAGVPRASIELSGDGDVQVEGAALTRVLANLFRNSAEAGAGTAAIRVNVAAQPNGVTMTVADDGPGVAAELGSRVFQPFVSSKARGHGLGLALASRVMSFLGGSLELVNPGRPGAVFRLALPAASAAREVRSDG